MDHFGLRLTWILLTSLSLQSFAGPDASKILQKIGLFPTSATAPNFDLADLTGNRLQLSDMQGKWVLLNFWATWCGPCRVEMPTLEGLHQELKDQGLNVIGINVDKGNVAGIKRFLKQIDVTFPTYLDTTGEVSAKYQASAIPSLYLISPQSKVVGIFKGAKNWEGQQEIDGFKELLAVADPSIFDQLKGKAGDQSAGLNPESLIPPEITPGLVSLVNDGKELEFIMKIRWQGEPHKYSITVPKIVVPKQLNLVKVTSRTSSAAGNSVLTYIYSYSLTGKGSLRLGPVTMEYGHRGGQNLQAIRHPGIEYSPPDNSLKINKKLLASLIGVLVLIAGLYTWISSRRKRKKIPGGTGDRINLQKKLNEIRRLKISGDMKKYCLELLELRRLAANQQGQEDDINSVIESVRFGGILLTEQEMKYHEKIINQYLASEV